ncbi:WD40-repeat-containing domain protein [Cercophora newfieldiana]|uniref:WD40-repeat-containing domain protein n=1 Tax=Cercophora newfieldiana TaxID=92897 RepID=A0AA39YDP1_9PEZI|nr:WD40-repeat-containing domain protein [Cercophora newfieldiana]
MADSLKKRWASLKKRWASWRERREKSKARDSPKTQGGATATATPAPPSTASPASPSGATSPAPSATQSTEVPSPKQGSAEYESTPSGTPTKPHAPTSPSTDHDPARSNTCARATSHHQPAVASQAPPPTPSVEPRAEARAAESTKQPSPDLSTSQRLWDAAYNSLSEDKDTAKLVESYMETLDKVLGDRTREPAIDVLTTLKDPSQRQAHMRKLVEEGQANISTLSKITQGVGDAVQFVLSAKAMVDLAIQNIPQAALPWAGVCIGLQILLNPVQAIESNLAGIAHVITRMDWYCALAEHILSQDNIVVGKESFKSVQLQLESRIVELYKALLLYQMKSVCSFYRHQPWIVLRGLANVDDWDAYLKSVTDTEATLQADLSQFNSQYTKSLLGKLVEKAEERKALLGDIHQALQSSIAVQKETHQAVRDGNTLRKEIHRDEKDTKCLQDLRLTDPRHDKTRIIETKGGLLADAYSWILGNAEFRQWRECEQSQLLWIKGDPGKGKTMLLCGIIHELQFSTLGTGLLSFFFCQATDARINNATAILRGLIYLLLDQQPSLIRHVRKKYDHAGKALFEDANGWVALSDIFTNILRDSSLEGAYLIIDALDECVNDLPKLLKFIIEMSSTYSHVKWVVSSRNWPDIEKSLNAATQIVRLCLELNEASVSKAITTYVKIKVHSLAERNEYEPDTRDAVQKYLSENAHGTFLWVALVCHELADIPGWEAEEILTTFPPGLNDLYWRMVNQIYTSRNSKLCKEILAIASLALRPITLDELPSLVDMPRRSSGSDKALSEIIELCGSFLTLCKRTISFFHQSAKDFLLGEAAPDIFPSGIQDLHHAIFSRSLRVMNNTLRRDIYSLDAPGSSIDNAKPPDPDPLASARYACVYWVDHLCDWQSSDNIKHPDVSQDDGDIDDFLRKHYLHWLEALSLCRSMSQGISSMTKLENILQQRKIASQLPSLVYDMRRFVLYCRWVVENYPLQVYASALVFSPARCITRDLFRQEERKWITTAPVVEDDWNACLHTMEHSEAVNSVAFSPDSKLVASGLDDSTVKLWDAATGTCTQTLEGHSSNVRSVTFSPDSKLVASGSGDRTVKIWDAATGVCTQTLEGHGDWVRSVTFSPDSKLVASGSDDRTVKIWDAATGACTQTLEGHGGYVFSVTFSPDSKLVASGSGDSTVKLWDAVTGACTQTLEGHSGSVFSVTFSPDSKLVASAGDSTVKLWDAATGACTQTLKGHNDYVLSVAFSPDSKLVASGSGDRTVKLWDAVTGACTQTLEGHRGSVFSVTFSPDSKLVASAGDSTVKLWDAVTGTCTQTLKGHNDYVLSVAFSPDSKLVASGSGDRTVKLWDTATGACTQTLEGHGDHVRSVTFSPDSKLVASGSGDRTVKLWDAATGACTQTLEGHSGYVRSVAFSPDSKLVASGSNNRTVKLWDAATGACTQTLEGHSDWHDLTSWSGDVKLPYHLDCGVSSDGRWITRDSENWLWLPPGCQAASSAIAGSTIAIGCSSGRVLIMTFSTDS